VSNGLRAARLSQSGCRSACAELSGVTLVHDPHRISVLAFVAAASGVAALMAWGDVSADPWTAKELMAPTALAEELRGDMVS